MVSDTIRRALLVDVHRAVEEAADIAIGQMKNGSAGLAYPPGVELSGEEADELKKLQLSEAAYTAIRKIMIDTAGSALFNFFTLVDGVGDPQGWNEDDIWLGVSISEKGEDWEPMWHDEWFETYWDYSESKHQQ